jgi:hypothetical protein
LSVILNLLASCENHTTAISGELSFSEDTIYFDTVFTSIGSVTKELIVYNELSDDIVIDRIYLSGGSSSPFRLNIDGEPSYDKSDIVIGGGDSIFIFVDVIIDPNSSSSPFSVTDSIIFITGQAAGKVMLQAWGQDVVLLSDVTIGTETWTGEKPYLVYGDVLLDTAEILTVEASTRIYFHRNASLTIAGSMIVKGTNEGRVLFASDRLEKIYEDVPGQWKGIEFLNVSHGNIINYAVIRGAITGVQVGEPAGSPVKPDIKLNSSEIMHCTVSGLSVFGGNAEAVNSVFSHCGSYCIYLAAGGNFDFTHCSVYNFWEYGFRQTPALFITEKAVAAGGEAGTTDLVFNNSMIYGDLFSEVEIIKGGSTYTGKYFFDHCLIRLDTLNSPFWSGSDFPSAIINKDPGLVDPYGYDFRPDSLSVMIDSGSSVYGIRYPFDRNSVSRIDDEGPDIGAYEWTTGNNK